MSFLSKATAMSIFTCEEVVNFSDVVAQHLSFNFTQGDPLTRSGFTGFGSAIDLNFSYGFNHGQYIALSYRIDTCKISAARVKLLLQERIQEYMESFHERVPKKKCKELRDEICVQELKKAQFVPSLVDIIYDSTRQKVIVSAVSKTKLNILTPALEQVFGTKLRQLNSYAGSNKLFERIVTSSEGVTGTVNGKKITLADENSSVRMFGGTAPGASITSRAEPSIPEAALSQGMLINRMGLTAVCYGEGEADALWAGAWTLDSSLAVTKLEMPVPAEKDSPDGDLYLRADHAFIVADIVQAIADGAFEEDAT